VAALSLRALLLESATPEERKTVENGLAEGPGPDRFFPEPVESEGYRRTLRRAAADTTFATILVRILAQRRWSATARDENGRRVEFDLEELPDSVQFVNWATSTLDAPARGYRGPLYRASIEVELVTVAEALPSALSRRAELYRTVLLELPANAPAKAVHLEAQRRYPGNPLLRNISIETIRAAVRAARQVVL
jgi:hypothetical protein